MYKLMIVVLLLALTGLFVVKGPSGKPVLDLEDLSFGGWFEQLRENPVVPSGQPAIKRVYTWKDDQGVTQFSDHEEDAAGATVLELNGIINTIPALPLPAAESARPTSATRTGKPVEPALPVGFEEAMDAMEQARQLQQTLEARKAEIDRLIQPHE